MNTTDIERFEVSYNIVESLVRKHATVFKKKHGEWLVLYAPKNQVVYMDTWNSKIRQAHCDFAIENDGYVDVQLHGKTHTYIFDKIGMQYKVEKQDIVDAIDIYKTLLKII